MMSLPLPELCNEAWMLGFGSGAAAMGCVWAVCQLRRLTRRDALFQAQIDQAYARGRRRGMCEGRLAFHDFDATLPRN